jgi:peptide/nickel transport system permease protein
MSSEGEPRFEQVDWETVGRSGTGMSAALRTLLAGLVLLAVLWAYDRYFVHVYIVGTWQLTRVDLLFFAGVVVLVSFVGVPALRHRESTGRVLASLRSRPHQAAAASYLALLAVAGVVGPILIGHPDLTFQHSYHAPIGFTARMGFTTECLGAVTEGSGITRYCHGTLTYPLGTNHRGRPMGTLLVLGARTALYVIVFTAAFVVPIATAVGILAGLRGGLVDDLLMAYVDIQLSIPAILLYFVGYAYWNPSLILLIVTFGLFSWGGIARLVRSEVLQRREDGYVRVARSLGASDRYIARRHLLPNVTNTVVPSVFQLLALLLVVEAGVAFLGFQRLELFSWGSTMAEGLNPRITAGNGLQAEYPAHQIWWISTFPAIALTLTIWSLKILGDGLRDTLDPRRRESR